MTQWNWKRVSKKRSRVKARGSDILPGSAGSNVIFRTCQFIEGEPDLGARGEAIYCGAKTRPGSPYCDAHHARCYTPREKPETS